jgi:hypothetical protein
MSWTAAPRRDPTHLIGGAEDVADLARAPSQPVTTVHGFTRASYPFLTEFRPMTRRIRSIVVGH